MRRLTIAAAALMALCAVAAEAQKLPQVSPSLAPIPAAAPPPPLKVPASPAARTLDRADVDAWLDGFMPYALRQGDIAGAVVVVVKDGKVLTQRGFGYADIAKRVPVDPARTLFRPGSVSKLVTWTAVMQLVEAGKLDLDADVNRYLDFRIPPLDGKPVTMRQIMTHTAGFEEHAKGIIAYDRKYFVPLGTYIKSFVPRRIFAPGTTPAYSNYATALAGYIVQRVSGMPYDDYIDSRVLVPLGMANSTFRQPLPARLASMMARGYLRASEPAKPFELVGPAPAGSLSSTGADMARFMIAHLQDGEIDGHRILKPETARMMHDTPTTILPAVDRMELGFFETNVNGREVIAHLGDTQLFHSALHLFLADGVGLYLAVNSTGREGAAHAVRAALFTDFADRYFPGGPADGRVPAKLAAEHARMMAGNWRASRRGDTGFFRALGLITQTKVAADARGRLVIPELKDAGGATRKWVEIAPFVWREANGKERLGAKVEDGRVVRWSVDSASPFTVFDRVPASMSSSWLLPLLILSLGVLLLTFLHWPAAAVIRRRYRAPLALERGARLTYRGLRLAAGFMVVLLLVWAVTITSMLGDLTKLSVGSDGVLWVLQILGAIGFAALLLFALRNLRLAFADGRRWTSRLWAVVVLLSALVALYVALTFGLLDMTVNY